MLKSTTGVTRQFLCYLQLAIDVDTVTIPDGSISWLDAEAQQPENAARFVLRRIQKLLSDTATLSNTKLDFDVIGVVDPQTKDKGLRLLVHVARPSDWVDEHVVVLRQTLMKNLTLFLDTIRQFCEKAALGKNLAIVAARPKGTDEEVIVCENPLVAEAVQDFFEREAGAKSKRGAMTAVCDKRTIFEIPAACQIDLESLPETATEDLISGYFQEPNTRLGTARIYPSGKTHGKVVQVSADQFQGIFEAQLRDVPAETKIKVINATLAGRLIPMRRELLEFKLAPEQLSIDAASLSVVKLPRVPDKLRTAGAKHAFPGKERRTGKERRELLQ